MWTVGLLACLLVASLTAVGCQILDFKMKPTPGDTSCGYLQCAANSSLRVVRMKIYDITEKDTPVELVSISIFAPEVSIEQPESYIINASGAISTHDGILAINFEKAANCLYRHFQCELDILDANGQPGIYTANLTRATEQNATAGNMLGEIKSQLQAHSEETDRELKALKTMLGSVVDDNAVLKTMLGNVTDDNAALKTILGSVKEELYRVEALLNSTLRTDEQVGSTCYRGMPHTKGREKFLLSGKLALCDTETDGGGWVIIQRRFKGDVDFYRGWDDYKNGFGTPDTDFWIGNDIIHNLTSQGYNELRIDFVYQGVNYFGEYTDFLMADEPAYYRITFNGFSGNAYNGMLYHNGVAFSTPDRDHDDHVSYSCAESIHGGWWYYGFDCYKANLNGVWGKTDSTGITWHYNYNEYWRPLTFTEMKIR